MPPKVSVVMSVFNGAMHLPEALDSIIAQTYADFEFVIIDDGSTDNTWNILLNYASRDNRLVLIRNDRNIGLTRSLNKGLFAARGKYIARQDDDDVSLPGRLERQAKFLDEQTEVLMVSCNIDRIDVRGRLIRRLKPYCGIDIVPWYLLFSNHILGHSQVMFRRNPVIELGGYSESFMFAQDYDLWVRLLEYGKIAILPVTLLRYRWHQDRISYNSSASQIQSVIQVSKRYISDLINEIVDTSEIYRLWCFWGIEPSQATIFRCRKHIEILDSRLQQIHKQFLNKYLGSHTREKKLERKMNLSIGERYLKWTLFLLIMRIKPRAAFWMFGNAAKWLKYDLPKVFFRIFSAALKDKWLIWYRQRGQTNSQRN